MNTKGQARPPALITTPDALHVQLRDMLGVVADILEQHSLPFYLACGTTLGAVRHGDLIPWDFDVDLLIPLDSYSETVRVLRESLPQRYVVKDPLVDTTYEELFSRVHLANAHHKYAHVDLFPLGGTFASRWAQRTHLLLCEGLRWLLYGRTKLVTRSGDLGRARAATAAARWVARAVPRGLLLAAFGRLSTLKSTRSPHLSNLVALYLEREAMPRRLYDGNASATLAGRRYPVPAPPEEYLERLYGDYLSPPPEEERARLGAFFESWYLPGLQDVPLQVDP